MSLYVAYLTFREATPATALQAFERRRTFEHPPRATVHGEYWTNPRPGSPHVVVIFECDDESAADYYDAAWSDLFEVEVNLATRPVTELPDDVEDFGSNF